MPLSYTGLTMSPTRSWILITVLAVPGCSTPQTAATSLAPRAAENIDPRVPVVGSVDTSPVNPALAERLSQLIAQANSGDGSFRAAAAEAERLAALAGVAESESWILAQQAVSVAVAARAPTARALSDIDETAATAIKVKGSLSSADLAAIEAAAAEVAALDRVQSQIVDALQARLGG